MTWVRSMPLKNWTAQFNKSKFYSVIGNGCQSDANVTKEDFDGSINVNEKNVLSLPKLQCEKCVKQFNSKINLERHISRVHEGIKPFQCESCGKKFGGRSNLKLHVQFVHGNAERNYLCDKSHNYWNK